MSTSQISNIIVFTVALTASTLLVVPLTINIEVHSRSALDDTVRRHDGIVACYQAHRTNI